MEKFTTRDLLDDCSSSSEDSFKLFKGMQRVPGVPVPFPDNNMNPVPKLFQRPSPSVLRVRKSLLKGLVANKKPLVSSTPMMRLIRQSIASNTSLQFSPIDRIENNVNYQSDNENLARNQSRNAKKQRKNFRKSKSFESLPTNQKKSSSKYKNPIIDSVVEQLQNLSTKYKDQNNKSKRPSKLQSEKNNATFSKVNIVDISTLKKHADHNNKGSQKNASTNKASLINKSVGTSPALDIISGNSQKPKVDLKSPKDRKKTLLVETETQTTDSLLKCQRPNVVSNVRQSPRIRSTQKVKDSASTSKESNINRRKDIQTDLQDQFETSGSKTNTPQASIIESQSESTQNNNPGSSNLQEITDRDIEEFLESFDDNNRNTLTVIEISSTLGEASGDGNNVLDQIKPENFSTRTEVSLIGNIQNNVENAYSVSERIEQNQNNANHQRVAAPLNDISNSLRSTPQRQNSKFSKVKTATSSTSNNNPILLSPTTRSKSKNTSIADSQNVSFEKQHSTFLKKSKNLPNSDNTKNNSDHQSRSTKRTEEIPSSTSETFNVEPVTTVRSQDKYHKQNRKSRNDNEMPTASSTETLTGESAITYSKTSNAETHDNQTIASKSGKRSKRSKKRIDIFKAQPPKNNRRTTLQHTKILSKGKDEKPRMTRDKRSTTIDKRSTTILQPYLALDRFSGYVQVHQDTLLHQQEDHDDTAGPRRSRRERKLPPIFIQSSILNPNVLRQKSRSKKASSDIQSNQAIESSSRENIAQNKKTNNKRGQIPTVEQSDPKYKKKKTPLKGNKKESQSNKKKSVVEESTQHEKSDTNNKTKRGRSRLTSSIQSNISNDAESKMGRRKTRGKNKYSKNSTEPTNNNQVSEVDNTGESIRNNSEIHKEASSSPKEGTVMKTNTPRNNETVEESLNKEASSSSKEDTVMKSNASRKNETIEESLNKEKKNLRSNTSKNNESKSNGSKTRGKTDKLTREDTVILNMNNVVSETIDSGVCCASSTYNPGITLMNENVLPLTENGISMQTSFGHVAENNASKSIRMNGSVTKQNMSKVQSKVKNKKDNNGIENNSQQNLSILHQVVQNGDISKNISKQAESHDSVMPNTSEGTVNNLEIAQIVHDSAIPSTSKGFADNPELTYDLNIPEVSTSCTTDDAPTSSVAITRKRSVTFLEPPLPKPKKKRIIYQDKDGAVVQERPMRSSNIDVIEQAIEYDNNTDEEDIDTANVIHAVVNNEVIPCKLKAEAPALSNCENNIDVKYAFRNIKSSWGESSWGYLILKRKQKKEVNIVRKHNVTLRVESGRGMITINRKKLAMKMGEMIYLPLGVEYSIINLLEEPLILLFHKATP